ncbi:MAG: shikimate dehydrogenase [bacterium]|nr:shikimate dehydrogenase [bacterium]
MKTVWILGHPLGHTLSPIIHNAAYKAMGLDLAYLAADVEPDKFADAIKGLSALGALGCNVTIPFKEKALQMCDELSEEARMTGSVNTISFRDGRIFGTSTDGIGFIRACREGGLDPAGRRAVIIGAGGAARACAGALLTNGIDDIVIVSRTFSRSQKVASDLSPFGRIMDVKGEFNGCCLKAESLRELLTPGSIVVQATPAGMWPNVDFSSVEWPDLPEDIWAFDLVYRPRETKFLQEASEHGAKTLGGLDMLIYQAEASIEIWTGQLPSAGILLQALENAG